MTSAYEVLAIRYGHREATRSDTYYKYAIYGQQDEPQTMDYFFWVIRNGSEVVLVDSGFSRRSGEQLKRVMDIEPVEALRLLGIVPEAVSEIIVSHGHYDHIGNLAAFPEATLVVQSRELEFWTGDLVTRIPKMFTSEPDELLELTLARENGRLRLVDGDALIRPGIEVKLVGGHSPGQQITVVDGSDNSVVIASDAMHFYEEVEKDMPFMTFTDLLATYRAFGLLRQMERSGATLVAGHDPRVMQRFPTVMEKDSPIAVRVG